MFNLERTFVAVKPDGVKRGLTGEVIRRFEEKGYKVIALKMLNVSKEQAQAHYAEHAGKPFYERLVKYIQSGPIAAMVLEGHHAIAGARHLMGKTDPIEAEVGTIRADFGLVKEYNIVHGSDSAESAQREIDIYFKPEELCGGWNNMAELVIERLQENEQLKG
ncbi:MAG: nucleoside-diphosphate kinase [Heliobacteriaceae bacterium]|jgi:nucleoside-diphosphate kinase|nr:nucleoside-diphosphate kinase [Heliobacteriaceae bacterium]